MSQECDSMIQGFDKPQQSFNKMNQMLDLMIEYTNQEVSSDRPTNSDGDIKQVFSNLNKFHKDILREVLIECIERIKEERLKSLQNEEDINEMDNRINILSQENETLHNLVQNLSIQIATLEKVNEEREIKLSETQREILNLQYERGVLINSLGSLQSLEAKLHEVSHQPEGSKPKDPNIEFQEERNNLQRCILEQNYQIEAVKSQLELFLSSEERFAKAELLMKDYEKMLDFLKNENDYYRKENNLLRQKLDESTLSKNEGKLVAKSNEGEVNKEAENEIICLFSNLLNLKMNEYLSQDNSQQKRREEYVRKFKDLNSENFPTLSTIDQTPRVFNNQKDTKRGHSRNRTYERDTFMKYNQREFPFTKSANFINVENSTIQTWSQIPKHHQKTLSRDSNTSIAFNVQQNEYEKINHQRSYPEKARDELKGVKIKTKIHEKKMEEAKQKSFSVSSMLIFLIKLFFSCLFFPFTIGLFLWRNVTRKILGKKDFGTKQDKIK